MSIICAIVVAFSVCVCVYHLLTRKLYVKARKNHQPKSFVECNRCAPGSGHYPSQCRNCGDTGVVLC